jgi:hypothetical protein
MSADFIKFAFIGGEVSDAYANRSDLEKYDLSLLEAENWQVDYLGGLSNCPGTILCEPLEHDDQPARIFPFRFSGNEANTNMIVFGADYIRFIQSGAYVLEASKAVVSYTITNPVVVEVTAHGYVTGDVVQFPVSNGRTELLNRTFRITVLTANTFSLQALHGTNFDGTGYPVYAGGVTVARVYTLASPYAADDLAKLRSHQIRDVLRLTHDDYPIYNLRRLAQDNWTLLEEMLERTVLTPAGITATPATAGTFGVGYVVTALSAAGEESLPSDYVFVFNSADLDNDAQGGTTLKWTPTANAHAYNVYRTRVTKTGVNQHLSRSMQVGLIGITNGAHFFDTGITPNFTRTPPVGNNPFADASITFIAVTNPGTGYAPTDTIVVTDGTGSGFVGYPVIANANSNTGPIAGVIIINGGKDYTAPSISVTTATGTGAVLSATLRANSGNSPALAGLYKQRQIYAAPKNAPLTVYGSLPGQLSNFDVSRVLIASDSFEHEVDSEDASPLLHMIPTRGGLLLMSKAGIWLMSGSLGGSVTATDVSADPQTYSGASELPPLTIDTDVLYCNASGSRVNSLAYADQYKLYSPTDISILASHLFERKRVIRWTYAGEPHRLVHAVRNDGVMLLLTLIKEQEVYAWTRRTTKGTFEDVASLEEGDNTTVYVIVRRKINGRYSKFIEKIAPRLNSREDEAVFLDCSLSLSSHYGAGVLTFSASSGSGVIVTSSVAEFTIADVGKIIRFGGGKARVTSYSNATNLVVTIIDKLTEIVPFTADDEPKQAKIGEWTLDAEVQELNGLFHLEGQAVKAVADGNVIENLVVTNGMITVPQAASRIIVGLPYVSTARNMPLAVSGAVTENKVKNITHIAMRLRKSRGVQGGAALDALYALKPRSLELYGEPNRTKDGTFLLAIEPIWDTDASAYIVQNDPLPATILGYVLEGEIGDDPS